MAILLTFVLLPFIAMIAVGILDKRFSSKIFKAASFAEMLLAFALLLVFYINGPIEETHTYIPSFGIDFSFQVNSLNIILVLMTSIIFFAVALVGNYFIDNREKIYNVLFLGSLASSVGLFLSSNLLLLFLFWEVAEVAMFFIIFIYGGGDRRYASIKFIIYSLLSSSLFLIAILIIKFYTPINSFNMYEIIKFSHLIPASTQFLLLCLFLISFFIKIPLFPLHSWLPDAHTEAPATGSMVLAGVLLKFGGYGLFLAFSMIDLAKTYAPYIALIAGLSALYGAFVALKQNNLKRLIAYTSIADMGIIAFALTSQNTIGTTGAFYGMLSHGLGISILFLLAGIIQESFGTLNIKVLKGIAKDAPQLSYLFLFGTLAAIGLPLTSGFIADLLMFIGAVQRFGIFGVAPVFVIILIAGYMFWTIERSFVSVGEAIAQYNFADEIVVGATVFLALMTVFFGIFPFILVHG